MQRTPTVKKYYACKFEGIGPKRNDFLEKAVKVMETKGFRLSQGWDWLRDQMKYEVLDSNIVLVSNEAEIGLRAKAFDNDLKVIYRYDWKMPKQKGVKKWLITLGGIVFFALFIISFILLQSEEIFNLFNEIFGQWTTIALMVLGTLLLYILGFLISRIKEHPMQNKIEKWMKEVAKSIGGVPKYVSIETALEPEDFLLSDESVRYQSLGKFCMIGKPSGKWGARTIVWFDFHITDRRILLLGRGYYSKEDEVITDKIEDIKALNYHKKGSIVKTGILNIETMNKKIGPIEGKPSDMEVILGQLLKHPKINPAVREMIIKIPEMAFKVEISPKVDVFYKRLIHAYSVIYGGGKPRLDRAIESYVKNGFTREEAIRKLAIEKKIIQ